MTHHITAMLDVHPQAAESPGRALLAECVAAWFQSSQTCGDACLAMVADLVSCIRTDQDCADVSAATGTILTRQTASDGGTVRAILEACCTACTPCAEECERHAGMHEHCRLCAEARRRCAVGCSSLPAVAA